MQPDYFYCKQLKKFLRWKYFATKFVESILKDLCLILPAEASYEAQLNCGMHFCTGLWNFSSITYIILTFQVTNLTVSVKSRKNYNNVRVDGANKQDIQY